MNQQERRRVIQLYRRCCIECGHQYFGEMQCPQCPGLGEPLPTPPPDEDKPRPPWVDDPR